MKWIFNTYNPDVPRVPEYIVCNFNETQEEAWQRYKEWLKGKHIGEPQATEFFTVEQLKAMDMVGVYIDES